jgi:hypothetical protein
VVIPRFTKPTKSSHGHYFDSKTYPFVPWKPAAGRVFATAFSFDSETTLIDDQYPWLTPAYVLGAAFDGRQGFFVPRDAVEAFFEAHEGVRVVLHNAPFDLAGLDLLARSLRVYELVERDLVWDARLLHRGYTLATEGHTASSKGQSTLEHCAELYLGAAETDVNDQQRQLGKTLNFGIIYGQTAYGLADELAMPIQRAAQSRGQDGQDVGRVQVRH